MTAPLDFLHPEERVAFALRTLYRSYGYSQFRMNQFEEYDFYVRNKRFLVSENIITFTDTNGKLMALKPDVTLSIIRNTRADDPDPRKVYYYENVYRPARGNGSYREIPQVGLEWIGRVDDYAISEVLFLAAQSLSEIAPRYALNISHLGILSGLIDRAGYPEETHPALFRLIGEKNTGELKLLTAQAGLAPEQAKNLLALLSADGSVEATLNLLASFYGDAAWQEQVAGLRRVVGGLPKDSTRLDFSAVGDRGFYSGIVFHGYVEGAPELVLSGGQYDKLMQKFGSSAGAIGFAVYLDRLDRIFCSTEDYRVDTVVLYDRGTDPTIVAETMQRLTAAGKRAIALRQLPESLTWNELIRLGKGNGQ